MLILSTLGLTIKELNIMKKYISIISLAALAVGLGSCTHLEDFTPDRYVPETGEKIKLVLNANRGQSSSPETRIYVGATSGNKVTYYWNNDDQIGIIPMNIEDSKPNYVTTEKEIIEANKNYATFNAYITADGFEASAEPHLLIYYPYNESMLEGNTGSTGSDFAANGLSFRLPQIQDQYGYSRQLNDADHPSVWALSHYGLAYDLAGCYTTTDNNDVTSTGTFTLDHANTYFQFNVYGTQAEGSKNDYGDGTWRLSSMTVEAGHCELTTDEEGNTTYTLTDQVNLAGTYKMTYAYEAADFKDVSDTTGNSGIKLENVAGVSSVKVTMNGAASNEGAILGNNADDGAPAFAVVNGLAIKVNPNKNLNCLKVSVTAYKYDGDNIIGSDTRIRYYNIENSIAGKDISGNFYSIDFNFCDPVESYTDLSVGGTGNCYIVSAPGNYTFNLDVAGNGKLPYGDFIGPIEDPSNLIDIANKKYGFDWLWASGSSFDEVNGDVQKIINNVSLSGEDGRVSIGLATGSSKNLSGNVVCALYEKNTDGSVAKIIWTWHLWLGQPEVHHYKFASTNYNWNFTNEDWYMMDRNIGAETAELGKATSVGLYYQRGRKEPMIGFNSASGSTSWESNQLKTYRNVAVFQQLATWKSGVAYSNYNTFSEPMSLISDIPYTDSEYMYAWNASEKADNADDISNDTKSMYDPCPVGYRMPTTREWDNMKADKFRWTIGGQGFGVFGYCIWDGLVNDLSETDGDERIVEYAKHAKTDTYTVNDQYERTYFINANSGTGSQITTVFPNTGVLNSDGTWAHTYQGDWVATTPVVTINHPAGPEVSGEITSTGSGVSIAAPQISSTPSYSNSRYDLTSITGTYFYSVGEDNPATTLSASSSPRIYRTSGTTTGRDIYLGLSTSKTTETVYFYYKDSNGNVSNPTTVTVTRVSNRNYTITYSNGEAKSGTTYTLNLAFDDGVGTYYYAFTASGAKSAVSNTDALSIPCSDITVSGGSRTVYLYAMNNEGNYSAATTVSVNYSDNAYTLGTITRGAAYTETLGGETESNSDEAAMALWSAGRLNEGAYEQFWFGPASSTADGWATEVDGDWGRETDGGRNTAPFTERRETHVMGVFVYGVNGYSGYSDPSVAIPIRCIREYDNAATANE